MPKYQYTAKAGPQKNVQGEVSASNVEDAVQKIMALGYSPLDVFEANKNPSSSKSKVSLSRSLPAGRVSSKDIVLFTRQLSDLVDASIPVLRGLELILKQTGNDRLRTIIIEMIRVVRDGGSLSDALAKHPRVFSGFYTEMVRTGEAGGQLGLVLNRLSEYMEKERETRARVKSSLAYPILVMGVGLLTIVVLLAFVIPRLTVMFDDMGQTLPLITRMIVGLSDFLARFWWLLIAVVCFAFLYGRQKLSTDKGRKSFDAWQLKLPVLGELIRAVEVGRFSRTLATLLESGVVISNALESVWKTIDNVVLRSDVQKIAQDVRQGSSLKAAMSGSQAFPEMATQMIAIGEETGHLDQGLYKVAGTYERQADETMKTLVSLLGPLALVGVVAIIGCVVIAMLLPIFQMNSLL